MQVEKRLPSSAAGGREMAPVRRCGRRIAQRRPSKKATIRARCAASGRRPLPAPRLSAMCSRLPVPGITEVTASLARRYLRKNWPEVAASKSAAHPGNFCPRTTRKSRLRAKGRSANTAAPTRQRPGSSASPRRGRRRWRPRSACCCWIIVENRVRDDLVRSIEITKMRGAQIPRPRPANQYPCGCSTSIDGHL